MTRDAHVLAQIYLAQLRAMAARHSYTHDGSLEDVTVSAPIAPYFVLLINLVCSVHSKRVLC